jgi:hypothetical protein
MEESIYEINLNHLTAAECFQYPDTFGEYKNAALHLLDIKDLYEFEQDIINEFKDDEEVQINIAKGMQGMEAITASVPDTYFYKGRREKREANEASQRVWFNLWKDYTITPDDPFYDLFFVYNLRQADIMELDNLLRYFLDDASDGDRTNFIRFLKLALRKHAKKLLQPEQTETIEEWIAATEKKGALTGIEEQKAKVRIKRERDDKVTILNQEQTALLIHCLRQTKIILKDEFLNNKEAGMAFSILTGYSTDTIRQNLSKSEIAKTANAFKNIDAVEKALKDTLKYIEREVKPEN